MASSDVKDQVKEIVEAPKQFMKDGMQFINRCKKPDQKEFLKITQAVAMGFAALGALGYFVKLIHIPINNILVGAA
ncbi:protein translocase SEC61 complex gamma subunit [Radiomyces spectabilis]|uniref:protein translocase SEC61 complex gamma subunit n=1 Tax=Radiomyces spectabilis TaxID=64574 RepID=UPI00221EDD34|nr:protein translocase SEC61 complex gamma subunit [Radiomyces spectabilis]KAI8376414.1 protein translocase SEC61 complex gamma subunit [Radiomyces spectabilis]